MQSFFSNKKIFEVQLTKFDLSLGTEGYNTTILDVSQLWFFSRNNEHCTKQKLGVLTILI